MAQHWIEFSKVFNFCLHLFNGDAHLVGHLLLVFFLMGYELMQGRVKESYGHAVAFHGTEDAVKVLPLNGKELFKGFLPAFNILRKNHFANSLNAISLKEHVLCSAKTYALCAKFSCCFCIMRSICIGSNSKPPDLVCPFHKLAKGSGKHGFPGGYLTHHYFTS